MTIDFPILSIQRNMFLWLSALLWLAASGCNSNTSSKEEESATPGVPRQAEAPSPAADLEPDTIVPPTQPKQYSIASKPDTGAAPQISGQKQSMVKNTGFEDLQSVAPGILQDIRYATDNNFTHSKIYDCPRCLLRPEVATALSKAQAALQKQGLGLKVFDCYRPGPYQQRLWDKVPDPNYVTPPAKGSMHSRGAAVDITLVDSKGRELDMGTPYDFFGPEAHTDYTKHTPEVLKNRRTLREALENVGFKGIRTEWWHFSYRHKTYPLSNYVWPCE